MRWVTVMVLAASACGVSDRAVPAQNADLPAGRPDGPRKVRPPLIFDLAPARDRIPADVIAKGDLTTCVFLNSTDKHDCYVATTYPGPLAFTCSGVGSCAVDVIAAADTELTWKSSCGGYAYSVVDGKPDTVGFECGAQTVVDVVTCTFDKTPAEQVCSTTGLPGPFRCKGLGTCQVWTSGKNGTTLTWSSTCGGTMTTVIDGLQEKIWFTCN